MHNRIHNPHQKGFNSKWHPSVAHMFGRLTALDRKYNTCILDCCLYRESVSIEWLTQFRLNGRSSSDLQIEEDNNWLFVAACVMSLSTGFVIQVQTHRESVSQHVVFRGGKKSVLYIESRNPPRIESLIVHAERGIAMGHWWLSAWYMGCILNTLVTYN